MTTSTLAWLAIYWEMRTRKANKWIHCECFCLPQQSTMTTRPLRHTKPAQYIHPGKDDIMNYKKPTPAYLNID